MAHTVLTSTSIHKIGAALVQGKSLTTDLGFSEAAGKDDPSGYGQLVMKNTTTGEAIYIKFAGNEVVISPAPPVPVPAS